MAETLIRVFGFSDGTMLKRPMWVFAYDIDAKPPKSRSSVMDETHAIINGAYGGKIVLTADRDEAMRFADVGVALDAWWLQSERRPNRPDGKPNRPLTAMTVHLEPV